MTIDKLYNQVYNDESTKDSDTFIDIYESNKNLIDRTTINGNKEVHDKIMRLTADYAHHLTMKEVYHKALPQTNKALDLFKTYPDFKEKDLLKLEFYEALIFDRAIANSYLGNIKEAKDDLKDLCSTFPDNDKYKHWLTSTEQNSSQKFDNILWYAFAGVLLVIVFFDKDDLGSIYDILLFIAAIIFLTSISLRIRQRVKKKY